MGEVSPCKGVLPLLRDLQKARHGMYILTSNYKENVQIFLKHHKIDKLIADTDTVYLASVGTKKRALKRIMARHNLDPKECYYVGNEALDVEAAAKVGIRAIATTWGGFNQEVLKKTKPFAIIDTPQELATLLQ